jgi:4-carboxymuconolactone decarboxylase
MLQSDRSGRLDGDDATRRNTVTEEEMIARGREMFDRCYGGEIPAPRKIDPKGYWGMSMKMFNDFWGDERLSFREKRLVVMGVLAGRGGDPSAFLTHARSAFRNGEMSPDDLRAVILMTLPYAGYPNASPLWFAAEKLIAELAEGAK